MKSEEKTAKAVNELFRSAVIAFLGLSSSQRAERDS
jgi:hypothetical protein